MCIRDSFDNSIFYNFLYRIREQGIEVPVIAGIMPVTNAKQVKRITQPVSYTHLDVYKRQELLYGGVGGGSFSRW